MLVQVKLFATYRQGRFNEKMVELPDNARLSDVIEPLDLPEKPAKILMVNGIASETDHKLNDKDVIAIFPMIAGG